MIEKYCRENLEELSQMIGQLTSDEYQKSLTILSNSSIGQHIRHITEFYLCLIKGRTIKEVNYDTRDRDLQLESDIKFAKYTIDKIKTNLPCGTSDCELQLKGNFAASGDETTSISTSFYRELAYCLEHSIHHQALIKIGLISLEKVEILTKDFGVAPATVRFKSVG